MEATQYYAAGLGLLFLILIIFEIIPTNFLSNEATIPCPCRRFRLSRGSTSITWFEVIFVVVHFTGNVVFLAIRSRDWAQFSRNAGTLSLINALPLSLRRRSVFSEKKTRAGIRADAILHRYVGSVVFFQALAHVISIATTRRVTLQTRVDITGLVGGGALLLMTLLCILFFLERTYSVFALSHLFLGLTIYVFLYFHTDGMPWTSHRLYMVIGLTLLCLKFIANWIFVAYRNSKFNGGRLFLSSQAVVQPIVYEDIATKRQLLMPDAIYLHIRPNRPWRFRGVQFIYLRFTDLDWRSAFQNHPFYVAWWYKNDQGEDVAVCVVEKRRGLTKRLSLVDQKVKKRVLVDGPYGQNLKLHRFNSILLFATGTGVAGLISIIAEIFKNPDRAPVDLRQVALFWEVDHIRHIAWISDFSEELLRKDVNKRIQIQIFVRKTDRAEISDFSSRVKVTRGEIPVKALIASHASFGEKTLICLCTRNKVGHEIKRAVRGRPRIHVEELEFEPQSTIGQQEGRN